MVGTARLWFILVAIVVLGGVLLYHHPVSVPEGDRVLSQAEPRASVSNIEVQDFDTRLLQFQVSGIEMDGCQDTYQYKISHNEVQFSCEIAKYSQFDYGIIDPPGLLSRPRELRYTVENPGVLQDISYGEHMRDLQVRLIPLSQEVSLLPQPDVVSMTLRVKLELQFHLKEKFSEVMIQRINAEEWRCFKSLLLTLQDVVSGFFKMSIKLLVYTTRSPRGF